jgi:hypothetical protein
MYEANTVTWGIQQYNSRQPCQAAWTRRTAFRSNGDSQRTIRLPRVPEMMISNTAVVSASVPYCVYRSWFGLPTG